MPSRLYFLTLAGLGVASMSDATYPSSRNALVVPMASQRSGIMGVDDSLVWGEIDKFTLTSKGEVKPSESADFQIITDGEWLYFRFAMPDGGDLRSLPVAGEDDVHGVLTAARFDPSNVNLQIFLKTRESAPDYYHFALIPNGQAFDRMSVGESFDYVSGWQHDVFLEENGWVAEVMIPVNALDISQDLVEGEVLGLNIVRRRLDTGSLEHWTRIASDTNSDEFWGDLVISSYRDAARRILGQLSESIVQPPGEGESGGSEEIQALLIAEYEALLETVGKIATQEDWSKFNAAVDDLQRKVKTTPVDTKPGAFFVWEANPWDLPDVTVVYSEETQQIDSLIQTVFQGEYANRALVFANPGESLVRLRLRANDWFSRDLRLRLPVNDHLALKQVSEVIAGGRPFRDALPTLRQEDLLVLPPGHNAIVWLTFDTEGMAPGLWTAGLEITSVENQALSRTLPLSIRVLPVELPGGPRPYAIGWVADPSEEPFVRFPKETAIADFKAYGVSGHIIPRAFLEWDSLEFDANGRLTVLPEMKRLRDYIDSLGREGQLYVLNAQHSRFPDGIRGDSTESVKQENFTRYVRHVREFFEAQGMTHLDFAWYAADEPVRGAKVEDVINMGRAIRKADPDQQIFVTVYRRVDMDALEAMAPYINIWVPKFNMTPDQFEIINKPRDVSAGFKVA